MTDKEPAPVAWWHDRGDVVDLNVSGHGTPLYFAPPQREWQGLAKEELQEIAEFHFHGALSGREFYDDIEQALKEKNT
jgi:hypothetical protein